LILASYPGATIGIEGAGCDLNITVVSELFADQAMIKQHQGVMATLSVPLGSGRLHAVTLKTHTPATWAALQPAANPGLLQIQI
jgi:monothiol glutaredoxin